MSISGNRSLDAKKFFKMEAQLQWKGNRNHAAQHSESPSSHNNLCKKHLNKRLMLFKYTWFQCITLISEPERGKHQANMCSILTHNIKENSAQSNRAHSSEPDPVLEETHLKHPLPSSPMQPTGAWDLMTSACNTTQLNPAHINYLRVCRTLHSSCS